MNYHAKYRPNKFSEVIGQPVSVRIMTNSILMDRVQSMLLSGIRGVGKTTLARLYGKALNCEQFLQLGDVCDQCDSCVDAKRGTNRSIIEQDAASHSGVDDVRELEKIVKQVPLYQYTVVILDECHMLSISAQNALLKTLEEPPKHVVFLLVTTNPDKLLPTIRSRCLSMPLRSLSIGDTAQGIRRVLEAEGKPTETSFVDSLAFHCGGSMRDVYQILEQAVIAAGTGSLDTSLIEELVGIVSLDQYKDLAAVLSARSWGFEQGFKFAIEEINKWNKNGVDLQLLFSIGVPNILRDFMIHLNKCYSDEIFYMSGIPDSSFGSNLSIGLADVARFAQEWEMTEKIMSRTSHPKSIWEMYIIKTFSNETYKASVAEGY